MGGTERLLIERLLNLSLGEEIDTQGESLSDHLRACLLLVSSHSVEVLPHADRVSYETYDDDITGRPTEVRGLAVPNAAMLLTDVIDRLSELPELPEHLTQSAPQLSHDDFLAALYAIRCILFSLEWRESMADHPRKFPPEKAQTMIAASLRSLNSYRKTGEP